MTRALVPRSELVVERSDVEIPRSVRRVGQAAWAAGAVVSTGVLAALAFPELLVLVAQPLAGVATLTLGLAIASGHLSRRHGSAVRYARRWEARFWRDSGTHLEALLGHGERVLDYCAVVLHPEVRSEPFGMYVLTNLRVFVTSGARRRVRIRATVPLREITDVGAGGRSRLANAEAFLDTRQGTGIVFLAHGRSDLVALFPTPDEAEAAADAVIEARRHAPSAERGALAIAETGAAGSLAFPGT